MPNRRENDVKNRRNENLLKNLPTEVLLKARSTLVSLGGALKSRQEPPKLSKQQTKDKKHEEKLKVSRSEPEFSEMKIKHRSRVEESASREYNGLKSRPLSVGANRRYDKCVEDFQFGNAKRDISPLRRRKYDSSEEVCVQSRLVIPLNDKRNNPELLTQEISERPRKKLSFREPEIIESGSASLGRSHKLMGVNSLAQRTNRVLLRPEIHASNLDGMDYDLESQAMKIVRTVGQAFEVCHKMQTNGPDQPVPSTSSAADDPVPSTSDLHPSKEAVSECEASESGAASTSKTHAEENAMKTEDSRRPQHLELLPPPPRKEGRRSPQRTTPAPTINLPDLPECVTKVEIIGFDGQSESETPLSSQHQLQLLQERLEQQAQQTRAAVAQLLLLRDQLAAEQAARCEAQARTHQLLVHNKELLEHIAALVAHLQERERGSTRPISAQQLTLLPQKKTTEGTTPKSEEYAACNGNRQSSPNDNITNIIAQTNKLTQNEKNNNFTLNSQFSLNLSPTLTNNLNGPNSPTFATMTNEEIQNYLISKFQDMGGITDGMSETRNGNQQFYQNSKAFPHIPPLANHCNNTDLQSFFDIKGFKDGYNSVDEIGAIAQAMSLGQSENSLCSTSQPTTSKDSTPDAFSSDSEGVPFIMPLSHNGMLEATGEDGRVRLIVPVSPSESTNDVPDVKPDTATTSGATLQVPGQNVAVGAPILRSTSEKVPNRSEMMTTLRSQWTRHTTK